MDEAVARRLVALNEAFYERFAAPFAASRATPPPGFERLLTYLPAAPSRVLDVGCGDGRFGRFLRGRDPAIDPTTGYTGVDFSTRILKDNAEIGLMRSAAFSPTLKKAIALGFLKKEFWEPGTDLIVENGENKIPARVAQLPFYTPVAK